jgi:phosphoglycerate kinase
MKTLSDFNFKGKTVLLRTDINSDVHNGKVLLSERIKKSVKTINELKKKKAKVVIIAHQGRPEKSDFKSLKQHARFLNKFVKVKFVNDVIGGRAVKEIKDLKNGNAILLDNIRKEKDEFYPEKGKKNKLFRLLELVDIYVNDAFSVCHRNHTSIVLFPKYLKNCAGRLLEEEINALKKIKIKKALFILGGAKPEDNIKLLKRTNVLACGLFGQMCLIAGGKNLGAQNKYLKKVIKNYTGIIRKLKKKLKNVETPIDFAVRIGGNRKELGVDDFPSKYEIFDIGAETIDKYVDKIKKAKIVFMKGPAGYCADKKFCKGTVKLLRAVSKNKGFSLIGGGHLSDAIAMSRISLKKFGHISLSGGALLRYVAGEKLVGLKVLK